MQTITILALLAAASVSADQACITCKAVCAQTEYKSHEACAVTPSPTYKNEKLPQYDHYDCNATAEKCYVPTSYGTKYEPKKYSYHRDYAYPGPKARFKSLVKRGLHKIGAAIKAVVGLVVTIVGTIAHGLKRAWESFAGKWRRWCAILRSYWERFEDWKLCKEQDWKDWWEHYIDLCRTRKALWDDAMREFHRQWHHYRKCSNKEYEEKKKNKCQIKEDDYDHTKSYSDNVTYYGVTPVEKSYNQYPNYDQKKYDDECKARDDKYNSKKH